MPVECIQQQIMFVGSGCVQQLHEIVDSNCHTVELN